MSSRSKASSYASGSERKPNNGLGSVSNLRNLLICGWSGWVELNLHLYISDRGGSKRWILVTQALFPIARCLIESGGGFQMDNGRRILMDSESSEVSLIWALANSWSGPYRRHLEVACRTDRPTGHQSKYTYGPACTKVHCTFVW